MHLRPQKCQEIPQDESFGKIVHEFQLLSKMYNKENQGSKIVPISNYTYFPNDKIYVGKFGFNLSRLMCENEFDSYLNYSFINP